MRWRVPIVLLSLVTTSSAHADTSLHATGEVAVAYNDNIQGTPEDPPAPLVAPVADMSLTLAPGITLFHTDRRYELAVSYARPYVFFMQHPEADTSSDRARRRA